MKCYWNDLTGCCRCWRLQAVDGLGFGIGMATVNGCVFLRKKKINEKWKRTRTRRNNDPLAFGECKISYCCEKKTRPGDRWIESHACWRTDGLMVGWLAGWLVSMSIDSIRMAFTAGLLFYSSSLSLGISLLGYSVQLLLLWSPLECLTEMGLQTKLTFSKDLRMVLQ